MNKHVLTLRNWSGTHYHDDTPPELVEVLDRLVKGDARYHFHLGDGVTGRDWLEEWNCVGRLSRSCGKQPIPIVVHNARSWGGGPLLDHCVVRIRYTGREHCYGSLWKHPKYHHPAITISECPKDQYGFCFEVLADGVPHARFTDLPKAQRWLVKMGLELAETVMLRQLAAIDTRGLSACP